MAEMEMELCFSMLEAIWCRERDPKRVFWFYDECLRLAFLAKAEAR